MQDLVKEQTANFVQPRMDLLWVFWAQLTLENLLLATPPKGVQESEWKSEIGNLLKSLLSSEDRSRLGFGVLAEMVKRSLEKVIDDPHYGRVYQNLKEAHTRIRGAFPGL